jgi:alkylation response protein AidB-like acyl-CoA dehydrogenase
VLRARRAADGFTLDGYTPWVTGAVHCNVIVLGATLDDGDQILVAVPTDAAGLSRAEPENLVGLASSHTGTVLLNQVHVPTRWLVAGPVRNVMARGTGASTGGIETSALAIGLASTAIRYLEAQGHERGGLVKPAQALRAEHERLTGDLIASAVGQPVCNVEQLRARANSIALRATQAALAAAKGSGYIAGHPVGRWCREALFFLVWSCPQPVVDAALCEMALGGGAER